MNIIDGTRLHKSLGKLFNSFHISFFILSKQIDKENAKIAKMLNVGNF